MQQKDVSGKYWYFILVFASFCQKVAKKLVYASQFLPQ